MIDLDQNLINNANSNSFYNRGTHIKDDAELDYKKFVERYKDMQLNEKQLKILEERKIEFRHLLSDYYNSYLNYSSQFVPVTVAGPSNYPSKKIDKIMERMNSTFKEMEDKIEKFYRNTDKMLKGAYSKDEIINKYRNGYNEPISSDDPLAKEKLQAKLDYLEEKHASYKEFNKKARKNGTEQLPPYVLANSNQNIKSIKDRLQTLEKMNNLKTEELDFKGGKIKFDNVDMRIKVIFDEIPNEDIRSNLKSRGFRWSPKNTAWQRKLTPNGIYSTKLMVKEWEELEKNLNEEHKLTM